jgi:hypothetical protein
VADPGCLSRIPDPDFYPSRIPDPKTVTKERAEKKICYTFFCCHKFHKIELNYIFLKCLRKKCGPIFKELLKFIPKNFSICSQIYGFGIRDPRSGKNLFRIPDPGVKKAPDPGSGSATLVIFNNNGIGTFSESGQISNYVDSRIQTQNMFNSCSRFPI